EHHLARARGIRDGSRPQRVVRPPRRGECRQVRVDIRHHDDGGERVRLQHDAGWHQLPHPAKLGELGRRVLREVAVTLLLALAAFAANAGDEPARGRVPTLTRLVKLFLEKESALGAAVRSGNAVALGAMLTDDFELRTGPRAASPVPRSE